MAAYCFEMNKDQWAAWIERMEAAVVVNTGVPKEEYDWPSQVKKARELQRRIDAGEDV